MDIDDLADFVRRETDKWEKQFKARFPERRVVRCGTCEHTLCEWTNNSPEVGIFALKFLSFTEQCPFCTAALKDAILTVVHN